jgi:hypothetical protein
MLSSPSTESGPKLLRQLSLLALNRLIPLPGSSSSTMAHLSPFLYPVGRNPRLGFPFFVFLRTKGFPPHEMQLSRARMQSFSHASTPKFSPTPTGSIRARTISPATRKSAPATHALCPKDRIVFSRAGACGFKNQSTRNNPARPYSPTGTLSYFVRKRLISSAAMTSVIDVIMRIGTSAKD